MILFSVRRTVPIAADRWVRLRRRRLRWGPWLQPWSERASPGRRRVRARAAIVRANPCWIVWLYL